VRGLLAGDPFGDAPPDRVRTRLYDYRFSGLAEGRASGAWWRRRELGPYCPPLALRDGRLVPVPTGPP
jgi:hypothetical protein